MKWVNKWNDQTYYTFKPHNLVVKANTHQVSTARIEHAMKSFLFMVSIVLLSSFVCSCRWRWNKRCSSWREEEAAANINHSQLPKKLSKRSCFTVCRGDDDTPVRLLLRVWHHFLSPFTLFLCLFFVKRISTCTLSARQVLPPNHSMKPSLSMQHIPPE